MSDKTEAKVAKKKTAPKAKAAKATKKRGPNKTKKAAATSTVVSMNQLKKVVGSVGTAKVVVDDGWWSVAKAAAEKNPKMVKQLTAIWVGNDKEEAPAEE